MHLTRLLFLSHLFIWLGRPFAGASFWYPVVMVSILGVLASSCAFAGSLVMFAFGKLGTESAFLWCAGGTFGIFCALNAAVAADTLGFEQLSPPLEEPNR